MWNLEGDKRSGTKNKNMNGKFIVFEGIDGCGKSTQAELLAKFLEERGEKVLFTREHTRDLAAGKLIEEVVNKKVTLPPDALQMLFVVDRLDHTQKVIKPALDEGKTVICDRYFWSTIAYSNLIGKMDYFYRIQKKVVLIPEMVVLVDIDPDLAMERMGKRGKDLTIFEKIEKLKKIREGYKWLAKRFKKKCVVVDGSKTVEEIHSDIVNKLKKLKILE